METVRPKRGLASPTTPAGSHGETDVVHFGASAQCGGPDMKYATESAAVPKTTQIPIKILLTDDDQDDKCIFKEALDESELSYAITCFGNGTELLAYLATDLDALADILFLDINMPKLNGLECLLKIRSNPVYANLFIAIYSTSASHENVQQAFKAGADLYIRKPSDFKRLKAVLIQVLKDSWSERRTLYNTNFCIV